MLLLRTKGHKLLITLLTFTLASCSHVSTLDFSEPNIRGGGGSKEGESVRMAEHASEPHQTVHNSVRFSEGGIFFYVVAQRTPVNVDWVGPLVFPVFPIGLFRQKKETLSLEVIITGDNVQISPDEFVIIKGGKEVKPVVVQNDSGYSTLEYNIWPWDFELELRGISVGTNPIVIPRIHFEHKKLRAWGFIP
jgi:hypothetical protein